MALAPEAESPAWRLWGGPQDQGQFIPMALPPLPTGSPFLHQDRSFYLKLLPGSWGLVEGLKDAGLVTWTK